MEIVYENNYFKRNNIDELQEEFLKKNLKSCVKVKKIENLENFDEMEKIEEDVEVSKKIVNKSKKKKDIIELSFKIDPVKDDKPQKDSIFKAYMKALENENILNPQKNKEIDEVTGLPKTFKIEEKVLKNKNLKIEYEPIIEQEELLHEKQEMTENENENEIVKNEESDKDLKRIEKENLNKIQNMSQEERDNALKEIFANVPTSLINKIQSKKLKKSKETITKNKTFFIKYNGEVNEKEGVEVKDLNYLNTSFNELNLETKEFSIYEIKNLLCSTLSQHIKLGIKLCSFLIKNKYFTIFKENKFGEIIFQLIFHKNVSLKLASLELIIKFFEQINFNEIINECYQNLEIFNLFPIYPKKIDKRILEESEGSFLAITADLIKVLEQSDIGVSDINNIFKFIYYVSFYNKPIIEFLYNNNDFIIILNKTLMLNNTDLNDIIQDIIINILLFNREFYVKYEPVLKKILNIKKRLYFILCLYYNRPVLIKADQLLKIIDTDDALDLSILIKLYNDENGDLIDELYKYIAINSNDSLIIITKKILFKIKMFQYNKFNYNIEDFKGFSKDEIKVIEQTCLNVLKDLKQFNENDLISALYFLNSVIKLETKSKKEGILTSYSKTIISNIFEENLGRLQQIFNKIKDKCINDRDQSSLFKYSMHLRFYISLSKVIIEENLLSYSFFNLITDISSLLNSYDEYYIHKIVKYLNQMEQRLKKTDINYEFNQEKLNSFNDLLILIEDSKVLHKSTTLKKCLMLNENINEIIVEKNTKYLPLLKYNNILTQFLYNKDFSIDSKAQILIGIKNILRDKIEEINDTKMFELILKTVINTQNSSDYFEKVIIEFVGEILLNKLLLKNKEILFANKYNEELTILNDFNNLNFGENKAISSIFFALFIYSLNFQVDIWNDFLNEYIYSNFIPFLETSSLFKIFDQKYFLFLFKKAHSHSLLQGELTTCLNKYNSISHPLLNALKTFNEDKNSSSFY